ncbi:tape measure protein [Mycolicibacterium sp. XJ1904]
MATKGVELASAYISLSVSVDGVPGQIQKALGSGAKTAKRTGGQAGQAYSGSFRSALNSGMSGGVATRWFSELRTEARNSGNIAGYAAGRAMGAAMTAGLAATTAGLTAAVGGIGYTLFKGFDRYKSLDATAKRLQNMGKSGEQVKNIVNDITEVVKGTPIALDEAAGAATKFLQGGVKEGQELNTVLTAIADASGASGENFGDLATIFGQVMNKGKLQAEEMLQFNERNINIQAMLRDEFGWTGDELTKLSEDGAISFQHLIQAVEGNVGGMAKRMGDTIDGALGNLQTSVARVGANLISAIFGDPLDTTEGPGGMAQAINNVTEKIDGLNTWVVGHQGEIKQFFTDAAGTARNLGERVADVTTFLKEHPGLIKGVVGAFVAWKTIEGVSSLTTALRGINTLLGTTIPASAERGAGRISAALLGVGSVALALPFYNQGLDKLNEKSGLSLDSIPGSGMWLWNGIMNGDWELPWQQGNKPAKPSNTTGTDVGQGHGSGTTGGDALDPGFFLGNNNPNNENTGGALTPATAAVQNYLRNQIGFTGTIGGWREPDGYNEHSSGKALDVMISGPQEGYALLPNMLTRPGVEYVIWDNKMWYPDGSTSAYTGPNPHTDHLHVKTFGTGGDVRGPGTGTSDSIPAWLSNGEHVLTAADVAAMGGQGGVYAFRNALHRAPGGSVTWMDLIKEGSSGGGGRRTRGGGWFGGGNPGKPRWAGENDNPDSGGSPDKRGRSGDEYGPSGPREDKGWIAPWWAWPTDKAQDADQWGGIYGIDPNSPDWQKRRDLPIGPNPWDPRYNPDAKLPNGLPAPQPGAQWPVSPPEWAAKFAEGGAVEDEMLKQFIQAGGAKVAAETAARMAPQPTLGAQSAQSPGGPDGQPIDGAQLPEGLGRTEGFIPAAAGFSGKTGGGVLGGVIAMGGEAAKGAIQAAADLGKMAASAAASAGTFGAGAAAGPAASAGIQIGADMAKRGVDYGVEMANIGIGMATEILSPFGAPRWLADVDPTAFMPNLGGSPLATTAAEALKQGMGPGMAHGQNAGQPPGPVAHQPGPPPGPVPSGPGMGAPTGQPVQAPPKPPEPQQQGNGFNFIDIIKGGIFDNGGVLQPNSVGVNLSNRPEYVFTDSQWKTMEAHASRGSGMNVTYNVMGKDLDDTLRELKKHERRQSGPLMRGKAGLG